MKPSQKLINEWYGKLKDSGFEDIEKYEYSTYSMTDSLDKQKLHADVWQAKQEYYLLASRFLDETEFDNEREKIIWTYHSEGLSIRNIAKILFETGVAKTNNKSTVGVVVKRLETKMKSLYLPEYTKNVKRS